MAAIINAEGAFANPATLDPKEAIAIALANDL
ncbi:hypothetical protein J2X71_004153 [Rhizobium sp. 1399]|jgi:hypothetical protein|nr:hypothetical protein [Rhizobium sp. 1399]